MVFFKNFEQIFICLLLRIPIFWKRYFLRAPSGLFKTIVGVDFVLVLIYHVTTPINWKCILTFVTFQLHKRALCHQANKNFHTYFSIDNVCNTVSKNRRKQFWKDIFFFSYGFRHVTRGGEGGEVSPGLFQKFEKSALI